MTLAVQHYVVFLSPGTFVDETSESKIDAEDPKLALGMSKRIVERYGARPYGFFFKTKLAPVTIEGHKFVPVETQEKSGVYYIEGQLDTYDQVAARGATRERTLLGNMRNRDWGIVCRTKVGYSHCGIFNKEDFVIDGEGEITERGDDPKHVSYRQEINARVEKERAARSAGFRA